MKAALEVVIDWLMEGDPAIRWQTMRDLCHLPADVWQAERRKTAQDGWGAQFLENMRPDGTWPAGRWTDTVWTLLTLIDCGVPPDHQQVRAAAEQFLERNYMSRNAGSADWLLTKIDLCHLGFWLRIGSYFLGGDTRLAPLADTVIRAQMHDGGWNCRRRSDPRTRHGSFHTTLNVLEGLLPAAEAGIVSMTGYRLIEARALEFLLAHQMYRSDHTGEIIQERFTYLTFPSYWHYTMLRGLDYLRNLHAIADPRLEDPIALILSRRNARGRWPAEKRIPGMTIFDMEKMGRDSRWNTLKALRVCQCRRRAIGQGNRI